MQFEWSDTTATHVTAQGIFLPAPLRAGFLDLDGRDLAKRLVLLGDLASQLAFIDPDGRVSGSWRKLFEAEPAFALAQVVEVDIQAELAAFETELAQGRDRAEHALRAQAHRIAALLFRLGAADGMGVAAKISRMNTKFGASRILVLIANQGLPYSEKTRMEIVTALGGGDPEAADAISWARARHDLLRNAIAFVLNTVGDLQDLAVRDLAQRLTSGQVEPAMGLLLAELRTIDLVAARINALPERLVQFYYGEVLGLAPREAPPERVLLKFPAPTVPVELPAQSPITARQAAHEWLFRTESKVKMIPAQVKAQAVLRYDLDPHIALSATFGAISGMRAQILPSMEDAKARGLFTPAQGDVAEIGVEIASPLLWLAEGVRTIEAEFDVTRRGAIPENADVVAISAALRADPELLGALGYPDPYEGAQTVAHRLVEASRAEGRAPDLEFLYDLLLREAVPVEALRAILGRILAAVLVEGKDWPEGAFLDKLDGLLVQAGMSHGGSATPTGEMPSLIEEVFRRNPRSGRFIYPPDDLFEMLLGDAFALSLSTGEGWMRPQISRARRVKTETGQGIGFQIKLDSSDPAIVAPAEAQAPCLRVTAAPAARIFPQSFFELYSVERIRIRVRAEDLKDLVGFGDDGRLDLSQSFMPFGIRPRDGASLSVIAPEMALKPISDVSVALDWAELPGNGGGFQLHYAQYGKLIGVPTPKMKVEFRSADGWKPLTDGDDVAMMAVDAVTTTLKPEWHYAGRLQSRAVPDGSGAAPQLPASREQIRAGAVRLTLTDSLRGFLAEEYPAALVRALRPRFLSRLRPKFLTDLKRRTARIRRRVPGLPSLPMPPFVPKIARLRLGYTAEAVIALNAPDLARPGERVTHLTPFGRSPIFPEGAHGQKSILPDRLGYGARFIQLAGEGALGPVSLLFEIAQASGQRQEHAPRPISWYYLGPEGWTLLPATALASDTTDGLGRTGVVMVDLPDDAVRESPQMPGQGYWLAAVADWHELDGYPLVHSVATNAVWALSERRPEVAGGQRPERDFALAATVPGLGQPIEVPTERHIRDGETEAQFTARVSASLRHRGWAITSQDIEDLVRDAFPEVFLAKCVTAGEDPTTAVPGQITLVVVPQDRPVPGLGPRPRFFDSGFLREVAAHVQARLPIGAQLHVRNPSYEMLRVRTHVRLESGGDDGAGALQLRDHVTRMLSVWTAPPDLGRFGWSLNVETLRSEIESLPSVAAITGFSVLQLVCDQSGAYRLFDTATVHERGGAVRLQAAEPWGLPLATQDHDFHVITDLRHRDPRPTGIGALRVGDMLIVNKKERV